MLTMPRHAFVSPESAPRAYDDVALPIGFGQTISQPYLVALMLESLELGHDERVLDVGTGSGYQAALMGLLAAEVYSVDIVPELVAMAEGALERTLANNVQALLADGRFGLLEQAPYDAIAVGAAAPRIPGELLGQLAEGGRLVIPLGEASGQMLTCIRKSATGFQSRSIARCAFIPLVRRHGW
jgi:protein-L-isoaspartate(D-aspartate) O-methyltransferase